MLGTANQGDTTRGSSTECRGMRKGRRPTARTTAAALVAATTLGLAAPAAQAAVIATLYNTGVDAAGNVLPNGTLGDPHYTLLSAPAASVTTLRIITAAGGFPIGPYLGDNTTSRWIVPNNPPEGDNAPAGTYVFRTTFDLTGLDPTSARITGGWSTDNNGLDIRINGVGTGHTTAYDQFRLGFAPFAISSGFVAGLNTLDFVVNNGVQATGNPIALRVQMSGEADAAALAPVPLPSALWLLATGLLGIVAIRRSSAGAGSSVGSVGAGRSVR